MAHLVCDFFSESLRMGTTMAVVLPQRTEDQVGIVENPMRENGFPVLYLLHGLSDDHSAWTRYTSIERYAAAAGLAVVMPAAARSFYTDEAHGHRYWQFVSEELPRVIANFFAVSTAREDTFVAGLSMGGYGALKLAFSHPQRYAAAASLSGVVDLSFLDVDPDDREVIARVFAGPPGPAADVRRLLDGIPPTEVPALHLSCGLDDVLAGQNQSFARELGRRGIAHRAVFVPGDHEWSLWDKLIQDVIGWLPIRHERG